MARKIDKLEDYSLPMELPELPLVDLSRLPLPAGPIVGEKGLPEPENRLPLEKAAEQLNHGVAKGEMGKLRRKNRSA
jgi:hypothetical protein